VLLVDRSVGVGQLRRTSLAGAGAALVHRLPGDDLRVIDGAGGKVDDQRGGYDGRPETLATIVISSTGSTGLGTCML